MEAQNLHQQRPRPALLLSTYSQLQAEVAAGILDHFYTPQTCAWNGSLYKGPKDAAQEDLLPERVRYALILAGCGFPVEQVPADLRQALLASGRTPSDLRAALQQAAIREQAGISGSNGSNGKQRRRSTMSVRTSSSGSGRDVWTSCKVWTQAFELLCKVSVDLQLPLAMHPPLPVPQQQGFLDYVDQLGCPLLSDIMARHRQYLKQVVQQWPLLGTRGCIAAKDYQPKQWMMMQPLPATALTVDCSACRLKLGEKVPKGVVMDMAGTAAHVEGFLCRALDQHWKHLPWLCKDGMAGLVLAGGVLGRAMAKPGSYIGDCNYDLFIIAPDQASYLQVVQETRAVLGKTQKVVNPDTLAAGTDDADPIRHSWAWYINVSASNRAQKLVPDIRMQIKLIRWPYCSPAALVRSWDITSEAAWFDGQEVFLDERCAWCHANRLLLADPYFDSTSINSSLRYSNRLLIHGLRLHGYKILIPGPMSHDDVGHIGDGLAAILHGVDLNGEGSSPEAQKSGHGIAALIKGGTAGMARWALLMACHQTFGLIPSGKPREDTANHSSYSSSTQDSTPEQQYSTAMAKLAEARQRGWPFAGFLRLPRSGDDGAAALGDATTWFSSDDLKELPRRLWLAVNCFVEL